MKKNALILLSGLLIIPSCKDKTSTPPPPIAVTGISLSKASWKLEEKETYKLEATITPNEATDKSVEWSSTKPDVATVADGLVTAVKAGTTTITAKSKSNTSLKAAECLFTVVAKEVNATAIKIEPASASVLVKGSRQLTAIMTPPDASDNVEWTSSDKSKATVSSTGLVEGIVESTVTVTITATSTKNPAIKGECKLTVTITPIAVTGLSLKPVAISVGQTPQPIEITFEPPNATNRKVTYSSDKPDIASVTNAGIVTGVSAGTATITATSEDGGKTAQCIVTVTVPVATITLGPNPAKVTINGTLTLTPDVQPNNASNKTLTYTGSDPGIATVTNAGIVTGVSAGTTTITATAADGSGVTKTLQVTVQSNLATLLTLTLGTENFNVVPLPAEGSTTTTTITVANAPRTISTILSAVPVTLTASTNATFKKGDTDFTSGGNVDFSSGPVTFKVTAEDGIANKTYTVSITAYSAASNPYGVYTAAHLNDVRNDKAGHYIMKNNITLPARDAAGATTTGIEDYADKGWLPIAHDATLSGGGILTAGGFTGIFDGGNFSIDNLYINRSTDYDFVGLFGAASGATIRNLGVNGTATPAVTGFWFVGALVGFIKQGTISNCYASANVSLTSGNTSSNLYVGGLLGYSAGTTINQSYSSGNISGNVGQKVLSIGGFGGYIEEGGGTGTVSNCFATGNISASSTGSTYGGGLFGQLFAATTNCYATGDVEATAQISYLGGLGGIVSESTRTNCYYNSDAAIKKNNNTVTPFDATTTGITSKPLADMKSDDFKGNLNGTSGTVWGRDSRNNGLPYINGVGIGK